MNRQNLGILQKKLKFDFVDWLIRIKLRLVTKISQEYDLSYQNCGTCEDMGLNR